jgi:hypothetical protein
LEASLWKVVRLSVCGGGRCRGKEGGDLVED